MSKTTFYKILVILAFGLFFWLVFAPPQAKAEQSFGHRLKDVFQQKHKQKPRQHQPPRQNNQHRQQQQIPGVVASTSADPTQLEQNLLQMWEQAKFRFYSARDAREPTVVWNGVKNVVNIYKYKAARCTAKDVWGSTYANPFQFGTLPELGAGRGEIYIAEEDSAVAGQNRGFDSLIGQGNTAMIFLAVYRFNDGRPPVAGAIGLRFNRRAFGFYAKPELVAYSYRYVRGTQPAGNESFEPVQNLLTYNGNSQRLRWGYGYQQPQNRLLLQQIIQQLPYVSSLLYRSVTKYELGFMDPNRCIK